MELVQELPSGYCYDGFKKQADGSFTVRCNISSAEEWRCWLHKFESSSLQKFIVLKTFPVVRSAFHQKMLCQHSERNKVKKADCKSISRNTDCKASISCKIKHVRRDTRKNDPFLRQDPPLPAILNMNLAHNHQTRCAEAMRLLRASDETRRIFNGYFNDGLSPASAISLHQSKLKGDVDGDERLANASINPTSRTVYYLHDLWRKENLGTMAVPMQRLNNEPNVVREHSESILSGDIASDGADHVTDDEADQLIRNVRTELDRVLGLVNPRSFPTLKAFLPCLKSIKTEKNFTMALLRCQSALQAMKSDTIKVRPTSAMRRRPGMKRGYRWVSAGRPTSK